MSIFSILLKIAVDRIPSPPPRSIIINTRSQFVTIKYQNVFRFEISFAVIKDLFYSILSVNFKKVFTIMELTSEHASYSGIFWFKAVLTTTYGTFNKEQISIPIDRVFYSWGTAF